MSDDNQEEMLDQLVFRWEGNRDRHETGITAVAYSCGKDRAEALRAALAPLLRVEGGKEPSLVRVVLRERGEVVLIHRRPARDATGRQSTLSHALLGPSEALTPRFCLALSSWQWGQDPAGELSGPVDRVPRQGLYGAAREQWRQFTQDVPAVEAHLTVAVAQLLRTPNHRVSMRIPEALGTGKTLAPLLMWGLCGVFEQWIGREHWTFATYDTVDSNALRVVCVPEWRQSATQDISLERITFEGHPQDEAHEVAADLVRCFLRSPSRPHELGRLMDMCRDAVDRPLRDRLSGLRRLLSHGFDIYHDQAEQGPLMVPSPTTHASGTWTDERGNAHAAGQDRQSGHGSPDEHVRRVEWADLPETSRSYEGTGSDGQEPSGPDPTVPDADPAAERSYQQPPLPGSPPPLTSPPRQVPRAPEPPVEEALRKPSASPAPADRRPPAGPQLRPGPPLFGAGAPGVSEPREGPSGQLFPPPSREVPHTPEKPRMTPSGSPHTDPATSQEPVRPARRPVVAVRAVPRRAGKLQRLGRLLSPARRRRHREAADQAQGILGDAEAATTDTTMREAGRREVRRRLSRLPDEVLLDRLGSQDVARPTRDLLLDALADRARWHSLQEADTVCREVLRQSLYLYPLPDEPDADAQEHALQAASEDAVWLFHWAVRPYVRHPGLADSLDRLLRRLCVKDGPAERHVLEGVLHPRDGEVPDLPPQVWVHLVDHLRDGSTPPRAESDEEQPYRPVAHGHRQGPQHGMHRAEPPDESWKFGCIAMGLLVVLLLLVLAWGWMSG
ncbi:hypothetical protein ABZ208_24420 [Streptomyces sp. NPDC006208]|uniref:hypothetical protein n=1 Tax=Streptomyces sp. NPDC006208 TaxID=3156734 RepID=UPI0033B1C04D